MKNQTVMDESQSLRDNQRGKLSFSNSYTNISSNCLISHYLHLQVQANTMALAVFYVLHKGSNKLPLQSLLNRQLKQSLSVQATELYIWSGGSCEP